MNFNELTSLIESHKDKQIKLTDQLTVNRCQTIIQFSFIFEEMFSKTIRILIIFDRS